ncbi:hypothetical protein FHL15_007195 [Xylaria flabelliformis]|uniref:Uncharacterized protein n=1 Tax=Xylaria flabelliformis TaxID=2512241 RepID=A0A553HV97_9PEZI|nr:hypothetical protein FHL15_007195 [Xylaria flabelliformis]
MSNARPPRYRPRRLGATAIAATTSIVPGATCDYNLDARWDPSTDLPIHHPPSRNHIHIHIHVDNHNHNHNMKRRDILTPASPIHPIFRSYVLVCVYAHE